MALLLTLFFVFSVSACGGNSLDGTYVSRDMFSQTFTFDGDKVTMSAFGVDASGIYKISGGQIKITYSLFGQDYTWQQPFSKSGSIINIGGTDFEKQ